MRPVNKRQKHGGAIGEVSFGYFRKGNAILRLNAPKSSEAKAKCVLGTAGEKRRQLAASSGGAPYRRNFDK